VEGRWRQRHSTAVYLSILLLLLLPWLAFPSGGLLAAEAILLCAAVYRSYLPLHQLIPRLERAQQKQLVNMLVDYFVEIQEDPEDLEAASRLLAHSSHEEKIIKIILDYFAISYR
jgi:hypothetical protein